MKGWSQVPEDEYRRLDLRAHACLDGVPLHDVWRVDLPACGRAGTVPEVRAAMESMARRRPPNAVVRFLFALRGALGTVLGWDREPPSDRQGGPAWSWRHRTDDADLARSLVPTGTRDGPFSVLYVHEREAVSEIRNATVHAFLVLAVEPAPPGHALYLAVHVLPVGAWTRPYMALIDPFRHWFVYPSLLRRIREEWQQGGDAGPRETA